MSPTPIPAEAAGRTSTPVDAEVDVLLRAWFDALTTQPVPEALLRHLDQLNGAEKT